MISENPPPLKPCEPSRPRNVTMEYSYWEFAKQLGKGNASKGIRIALYQASLANNQKEKVELSS